MRSWAARSTVESGRPTGGRSSTPIRRGCWPDIDREGTLMTWYKAAWIPPLFAALDQRFPARDRASDGTIGDPAHQAEVSGHNPDDTPGVRAERSDADSKPEVRAADVTSALGDP